jgi:hypothetical protein
MTMEIIFQTSYLIRFSEGVIVVLCQMSNFSSISWVEQVAFNERMMSAL